MSETNCPITQQELMELLDKYDGGDRRHNLQLVSVRPIAQRLKESEGYVAARGVIGL